MPTAELKKEIETKLHNFHRGMKMLGDEADRFNADLLKILHHPGYTTPAQARSVIAGLDTMILQTRVLEEQKKAFLLENQAIIGEAKVEARKV